MKNKWLRLIDPSGRLPGEDDLIVLFTAAAALALAAVAWAVHFKLIPAGWMP